jgi:zinc/manganese transport system ATP-binding protein
MDGPEDRSIERGQAFDALAGRGATARRAVERAVRASGARAWAAFQHHFDAGYAPRTPNASDFDRRAPELALSQITAGYHGVPAIENVTADFPPGSMTAIVGPNGAGKSTLLKVLAGILRPRGGQITRGAVRAGDIAYLPQSDEVDRSFPVSVAEFVALGRWRQFGAFRPAAPATDDALGAALDAVGLAGTAARPIAALSVGQFRRVLFARLMLQDADALLLDEPFAAVDAMTMADLLRLVARWHVDGRTVIAVLHDLEQVRAHFPRTVLLARRCIGTGDTAAVLTPENLVLAGIAARDGAAL